MKNLYEGVRKVMRKNIFMSKVQRELGEGGDVYEEICIKCGYVIKHHYLKLNEKPKFSSVLCTMCYDFEPITSGYKKTVI